VPTGYDLFLRTECSGRPSVEAGRRWQSLGELGRQLWSSRADPDGKLRAARRAWKTARKLSAKKSAQRVKQCVKAKERRLKDQRRRDLQAAAANALNVRLAQVV